MSAALDVRCVGCGKTPDELLEYREMAAVENTTPLAYVQREEGTYNPHDGAFACTECYLAMGAPSQRAPNRWIAHHGRLYPGTKRYHDANHE